MSSDLLTTVLRDAGLSRRLLDLSDLSDAQALRFPCERSMGLHVVLRGPVHLHAPELPAPLALDSGDVAVMARGCDHVLSLRPTLAGQAVERIDARAPATADAAVATGVVLSGAYQLWHTPLHPFFAEMPAWSVLRAADMPRLGPLALTSGLLAEERRGAAPGADIVVQCLLDVVFTYALRLVIGRCAAVQAGWSQALNDPQIGRVVARMHEAPAHPWSLASLARDAGLSRTALAERFRTAMGDTPLNHLRTLRMQRAMQLLSDTSHHLEAVAAAVGYQDAFTFSKVFKRTVGVSPKAFRQGDQADRANPFRFQAG
jgi:AraC-like DNA-binding protein